MKKGFGVKDESWKAERLRAHKGTAMVSAAKQKTENDEIQAAELSRMFHELGNLITVLQIGAQNLSQYSDDSALCHRSLVILREANNQLGEVIKNLTTSIDAGER